MKKILFLTNKDNGAHEEDEQLIELLGKDFDLIVSHPLECTPLLPKVEGVIIRNIWPTHEYADQWVEISQKIRDSGLPTYNSLAGNGDTKGKDYLLKLYKSGYPVIPSVDNLKDVELLGHQEFYWIKPKDSCDGWGSGKYSKNELGNKVLTDYIIQPYVSFVSEPSFFFIDSNFSHAITMPNRLIGERIQVYKPTDEDIVFAQRFVDWNKLPHGIQRIDAVRTNTGELLLTEVEDLCPYLYVDDLDADTRKKFLNDIRVSVIKTFN